MRRLVPLAVRGLTLAAALVAGPPNAGAQPISRDDLPPSLRPWVPWVLEQVPTLGCATVQGQAVCLWPGQLKLELGAAGGSFQLELQADRAADVRLPGSTDTWPQDVRLDGSPAPVFDKDGAPRLRVAAGRHRLSGRFAWSRLPESLSVPAEIGLVDLRLDGQAVPRPRRDQAGLLWLRASAETHGEGESLRLQVFRRIRDGIPLFVETRLELEVAGRAREVTLEGALLPGTTPVAVSGDLPARVENATLRVQVRGGRYALTVDSRIEGRPKAIALPKDPPRDPWPPREVWVFAADEAQRQVELSGPTPIDPSRTELPEDWRALPAFLVEPGASLALGEVRRGEAEPPPDQLTLARQLWLDPDGRAASVRDQFGGELRATTRLDLLPPGTLGRIAIDGQDQLVTAHPETKAAGIELRHSSLQLEADSRLALTGALPAVGWTTGVEQLQTTLHVPPGWSLLATTGVDQVPGTWTSRWSLLGFFFVLIVTLAVHRLFGPKPALLALAAPRPHARRARRAVRRVAEPRGGDRAPARRAGRPLAAARAALVPRERRRARRRRRALRARSGARGALPAGRAGRCRTGNDRRQRTMSTRSRHAAFPEESKAGCRAASSAASSAAYRTSRRPFPRPRHRPPKWRKSSRRPATSPSRRDRHKSSRRN